MTTLDHVIATHQSEWVSFSEEPLFPTPLEGGAEEHFPGLSSSSERSESSSGENHAVDEGSQDLSHSEQDDSSEKMGLISEAASPPGSPVQPTPDLASAISSWVQFEDDTPWSNTSPPHGETDNSSSLQEDEEVEMEAISWWAGNPAMNGHPAAPPVTTARFPSWVTFEDNEVGCPSQPVPSPKKPNTPSVATAIPDVPFNSTGSFKRDRPKSTLMNLSKVQKLDISSLNRPPSVIEAPPWRATNPFLNETLQDVQPSPINPFSAFFEEQERRSQNSSISSTTGKSQRDSLIVIYQDAISFDDSGKSQPHPDAIEKLKQLQIDDPDPVGNTALPDDDLDAPSPASALSQPRDGWPMMLRIPEKKNIMSSRHWGPIYIKLTDSGYLQLYYEQGLEKPFREFKLEICHEVSEPRLQNYDENGRIHSLRIDRVTYKEKKKYQPKPAVAHAAEREQVIKLGTTNYDDFLSFIHAVQDRLMDLPVLSMDLSTVGLNYLEEEITVDVRDEFTGTVSKGDNQILQHHVLTRIHILSFLSGLAECRLGLNDILIKGNEIVSRQDIMPTTTTKWIKLHECRFHGCVDEDVFTSSRVILFNPLDACRFELMRFRTVFAEKALPFTLRTAASINGAEVEVQSWLRMSPGFSSNRDPLTQVPCENVMVRYPVPSEWVKNFRRESVLGEKSLKAKVNRGASFGSAGVSGSEPVMRVSLGTAKYEHAFNSIVWRINRLPDKNSASGHPHCFFCHLELGSDREVPSRFANYVNVEFSMPTTSASKAAVRSVSVEDKQDVRKWVNYSAHYSYKVEIEQKKSLKPDFDGEDLENPQECGVQ
ncbi:stonin-2 isoform X2 [Mastomys coucha]|uniref:stonin-2 isoform X2 n=1 Tax=Mastomys coucha TaxID=35658 RepID=UPI0012619BA3|nr:stonin-2 isoform X2 [Mastomys coucha]